MGEFGRDAYRDVRDPDFPRSLTIDVSVDAIVLVCGWQGCLPKSVSLDPQ